MHNHFPMRSMLFCLMMIILGAQSASVTLSYSPSADGGSITAWNPLRGMVPYSGQSSTADRFPHSMENFYIPMKRLTVGPNSFDWTWLETQLNATAKRGHHSIIRVYLDYPKTTLVPSDAVPAYLIPGLKFNYFYNPSVVAPDYFNQTLISACVQLINALGAKYDGDNRIGVIQVGLLGHWGEWHMSPNNTFFPGAAIQDQILAAFQSAFQTTQIVARNPARIGTYKPSQLRIGYHDDSYTQDTISANWHFYPSLVSVNGTNVWKQNMMGGELRPELMPCIFAENITAACKAITTLTPQDWTACTDAVHPSWMWNSYAFGTTGYSGDDLTRALAGALQMGYRFTVSSIVITQTPIDLQQTGFQVAVTIKNLGNAPFYYPLYVALRVTYTLHNATQQPLYATITDNTQSLQGLLPGDSVTVTMDVSNENNNMGHPDPTNVASIGGEILLTSSILLPSQRILFDVADDSSVGAFNGTISFPAVALEQGSGSDASSAGNLQSALLSFLKTF